MDHLKFLGVTIYMLLSVVQALNPNFCFKKGTGLYPDVEDCTTYYSCFFGLTYHLDCPPSLVFNPEALTCDWPINVNCSGSSISPVVSPAPEEPVIAELVHSSLPVPPITEPQTTATATAAATTTTATTEPLREPVATTTPPFEPTTEEFVTAAFIIDDTTEPATRRPHDPAFCEKLADGLYADPVYCASFYHCYLGATYHKTCQLPLLYNPLQQYCDWDYLVDCTHDRYPPSPAPAENIPAAGGRTRPTPQPVATAASGSAEKCGRLVCYYPNWAIYRNGVGAKFGPNDIDPDLCTHIIYAFAGLRGNRLVATDEADEAQGSDIGNFARVINLKKERPGLKVLLAVGGWKMGSVSFSQMASTEQNRKEFANTTVDFLVTRGFDGLDVGWEYPANRGSPSQDKERYAQVLEELRRAFDKAESSEGTKLLLSAAVSAGKAIIDTAYNVPRMVAALDFINVMTYDLHGSWDSKTGHNSPLKAGSWERSWEAQLNVEWVANYWVSLGAPKSKLVIGIPTYAKTFRLQSTSNTAVGAPAAGPGQPGRYTSESGTLSYYEVCSLFGSSTRYFIESQRVPFIVNGDQWIGYDDPESVKEKVRFIKDNGFGGVMVWDLSNDDFSGRFCGEGQYPLMNSINSQCAL